MSGFINFLANNYVILIIITLFLIFALVGYFVEIKRGEGTPFKLDAPKEPEIKLEDIHITNNISLQEMVKENAGIKGNTVNSNNTGDTNNPQML